jgi:AcrR family transcriptional regulator
VTTRRYDSTLRRQRAEETHDRIVAAGCDLLAETSVRDWRALTMRAVAERAGVNERTVYRHFTNERGLRDSVMRRLEQRAGIDLDGLALEGIAEVAGRIFATVGAHPLDRRSPMDPTLHDASRREREALLRALEPHAAGWTDADRAIAAAMLNAMWRVAVYEHLVVDWDLDPDDAVAGITWVIGLVEQAVRDGRPPGRPVPPVPPVPRGPA